MRCCRFLIAVCCVTFFVADSYVHAQPPGRPGGRGEQGRGGGGQRGGPGQGGFGDRQGQGGMGQGGMGQGGMGQGGMGQRGQGRGGQGWQAQGGQTGQQSPPWIAMFDADSDGEISTEEINDATASLLKLDRNGDGRLTGDEFRPTGGSGAQARPTGGQTAAGQGGPGGGPSMRGQQGQRGGDPAQEDAAFVSQIMSLDGNKDGLIAMAELPEHMHEAFEIADADKNESLRESELLVLASQFRRNQLNPDEGQEMKNAPTQGRGGGHGQTRGGQGQSGRPGQGGAPTSTRGRQGMGQGQRGNASGGQASRGGERERPRDKVRQRDTQFNERFSIGSTLPDSLQLYNVERELVPASSIFNAEYTVVVGGCLTCPEYRNSYPEIEAVAADYRAKGVQFYFLYQSLTHPENWDYVQPTSIQERFAQVDHAKELLQTQIPWLTDTMDNEMKQHFGMTPNSQFLFDRDGKVVHRDSWGRGSSLRESLIELVGASEKVTTVAELNLPQFGRHKTSPADMLFERRTVEGVAVPLRVVAGGEEVTADSLRSYAFGVSNRYAKLRPEADQQLLQTGNGQLYLGFRQDPILGAAWNNLATPPKYRVTADGVTLTPAMAEAEKLSVESDTEPREFLLDVQNWEAGKPIKVEIQYFACNKDKGWCRAVTQEFTVWLEQDRTAGMVAGRSHFPGGGRGTGQGGHRGRGLGR